MSSYGVTFVSGLYTKRGRGDRSFRLPAVGGDLVEGSLKVGETLDDGGPFDDAFVVVHKPAEAVLDVGEGAAGFHHVLFSVVMFCCTELSRKVRMADSVSVSSSCE